ncbi:MAG: septum formation protein Maf [Proteobacteria bacterium]|jgi:septum formation protein|nr:septum formation protein Maf [Pseudomonadota bacterium]
MLLTTHHKIILASTSAVRQQILQSVQLPFVAVAPNVDEDKLKKQLNISCPLKLALELAKAKALSIAKQHPDAYIIGADQVCALGDSFLNKAKTQQEAVLQLNALSGKTHTQNNGFAVVHQHKVVFSHSAKVSLTMQKLSLASIKKYVESDNPVGCAGSYKYESLGKHLFSRVNGNYYAVLGLNIQPLLNFFYTAKIITF